MDVKKTLIAGPCALESRLQLKECVSELKRWKIPIVRASLWKPRTLPKWDGIGDEGIFTLLEETLPHGIIPATEVLIPEHVQKLTQALKEYDSKSEVLVWLGARNQNHLIQQEIAKLISLSEHKIHLLCKNQMWRDQTHWESILDHALAGGLSKSRFLFCHRGFSKGINSSSGLRNEPDFEMAMSVKKNKRAPMLLDPSHIGGNRENTIKILEAALQWDFDGFMIEVHSNPGIAKTDRDQQLSLDEFSFVMEKIFKVESSKEGVRLGKASV